jgi:hypothetical protein
VPGKVKVTVVERITQSETTTIRKIQSEGQSQNNNERVKNSRGSE